MTKGRVLLIGGNYFPEPTGIGKYNGEMVEWLAKEGFACSVVTTYPYYPFWKVQEPYAHKAYWFSSEQQQVGQQPVVVYRCPHYVPGKPTALRRVLSDLSFFITGFFQLLVLLFGRKFDFVFTAAPPFQIGLLGLLYQRLRGATFIYHIQDLQIDAASELGMLKGRVILGWMFRLEKFILKHATHVSAISEGMIKKMQAKIDREILLFPNWADTRNFFPLPDRQGLKEAFGIGSQQKVVLYSGAIGEKQGLDVLLSAAGKLMNRADITFVICGSGPYKEQLVAAASQLNLSNVLFLPLQDKNRFNLFLNMADVHLVLQRRGASDLMMPSKLTSILSVGGLALVTAETGTTLHSVIASNEIGEVIIPDCTETLTTCLLKALDNNNELVRKRARDYAVNTLGVDIIMSRFLYHIGWGAMPAAIPVRVMLEEEIPVLVDTPAYQKVG